MPKEIIHPAEGNTANIMVPLIPFNCIFDTDFGMLSYISANYKESRYFSKKFLNSHSKIKDMVLALSERTMENPLSLCINKDYDLDIDYLYQDFIDKKYTEILDRSMATDIFKLALVYNENGIKPTIICEKQEELDFIDKNKTAFNSIAIKLLNPSELKRADTDSFQQIFLKSTDDFYCKNLAKYIYEKTVYLSTYKFNDNTTNIWNTVLSDNRNEFKRIEFYNISKLKGDNTNV